MARYSFSLKDLTRDALERLVSQLADASDSEEKALLKKLSKPQKNDLADLDEEMHGKPNTPKVEDDSPFDLGSDSAEEDDSDMPKKGKK